MTIQAKEGGRQSWERENPFIFLWAERGRETGWPPCTAALLGIGGMVPAAHWEPGSLPYLARGVQPTEVAAVGNMLQAQSTLLFLQWNVLPLSLQTWTFRANGRSNSIHIYLRTTVEWWSKLLWSVSFHSFTMLMRELTFLWPLGIFINCQWLLENWG